MLHKQYQQGNTFLPFLGLIAIASLITVNIWLYAKSQKEVVIAPAVVQPTATTTDTMADWQTYTNDQYGFNIKYPSNWVTKEIPNQEYGGVVNFFQSGTKTYPEQGGSQPIGENVVTLSLLKNPDDLTLQQIFNNNYNKCLQQPNNDFGCPGPQNTESWQTITVDGAKAWRTGDIGIPEGPGADTLYIKQDGYYIEMTLMFFEPVRKNIDTAILDRMISTFRFTDDMSDWQTYKSRNGQFEFNYPAFLTVKTASDVGQFPQLDGQSYQQYWDGVYIDYTNNYTDNPSGEDISLSIWHTNISADEFKRLYDSDGDPYSSIAGQKNITFNAHPAILIKADTAIGVPRYYMFPKAIPMVIEYYNATTTQRILSTLKFIK